MCVQIEFFQHDGISIVDGGKGILFVHSLDHRRTGDAFFKVKTKEDATKVLLKHKQMIGNRYVEIFRSTAAELQQICTKNETLREFSLPPITMIPRRYFSIANRRDSIYLRYLPLDFQIEDLLEFLGGHSNHIVSDYQFESIYFLIIVLFADSSWCSSDL